MGLRVDGRDELPMRAVWKRTTMVMNLRLSALAKAIRSRIGNAAVVKRENEFLRWVLNICGPLW
jgi:hypothetical protein